MTAICLITVKNIELRQSGNFGILMNSWNKLTKTEWTIDNLSGQKRDNNSINIDYWCGYQHNQLKIATQMQFGEYVQHCVYDKTQN